MTSKQKASQIYMRMTSYAPYNEMNGISREWMEKKIAEGLEEYARQKCLLYRFLSWFQKLKTQPS